MTRPLFFIAALAFILAGQATGQQDLAPGTPELIQKILNKKCGECHSSTVRKPKGAFGFVDDLARVKKEYSRQTDLDENDLWYYVADAEDDIMPPTKSKNGPLSKDQLALIKSWILAGSPLPTKTAKEAEKPAKKPEAAESVPKGETTETEKEAKTAPLPDDILEEAAPVNQESSIIAPFHPVLVHFPIALIMVAALMEFLRMRQGESWRPPVKLLLALVLISSVLAGFAGFRAQDAEGYKDETVEVHQWTAIAATAQAAIATWLIFSRKELGGSRLIVYRAALVVSAVLFGVTGHEGGILVFGPDHFG